MILQPEKNRDKDKGELISHPPAQSSLWDLKALFAGIKNVESGRFGMGGGVDPLWDRIWGVGGFIPGSGIPGIPFPVTQLKALPPFPIPLWKSEHSLGFAA